MCFHVVDILALDSNAPGPASTPLKLVLLSVVDLCLFMPDPSSA